MKTTLPRQSSFSALSLVALVFLATSVFCATGQSVELERFDGDSQFRPFEVDGVPFTIAKTPWDMDGIGTHRALVEVASSSEHQAVVVTLPWKRPDLRPETKKVIVIDATTSKEVSNVTLLEFDSEKGTIAFEPETVPSVYYVYYLPCRLRKNWDDARYGQWNDFIPPDYTASPEWVHCVKENVRSLPEAKLIQFEARTSMDFFTPMGIIATEKEETDVKDAHADNMLVFPEDRTFPSRLVYHLSYRWAKNGPSYFFAGYAAKNEYYVWQIGLWASRSEIRKIDISFSDFVCGTSVIPASEATCFNTGGTNWDGKPISFTVNVPQGRVQPLWCGIQIPRNAQEGVYKGKAMLTAETGEKATVDIEIHVEAKILEDKGDGDLWRHARLRWLNSTIGIDNKPTAPYETMNVVGDTIFATGKEVSLVAAGLPKNVKINDKLVFASPVSFVIKTETGEITFVTTDLNVEKKDDGLVEWTASSIQEGVKFRCKATMEFDGYLHYSIDISSSSGEVVVEDIKLVFPFTPYASEYFMGIGYSGGFRPVSHEWNWTGPYDSFWIGNIKAGMHVEFRGGAYHGPLINDYKPAPPASWYNEGKGGISVEGTKGQVATVTAFTGKRTLTTTPVEFEFAMLITPVKQIDTAKHFQQRYYHGDPDQSDVGLSGGATVFNIHHAGRLNPVINYPWFVRQPLIDHISAMHEKNVKVKLYYTIRELTTHATELHALKSLNHEIFVGGVGYGSPWLCEHLIDDYRPAWYTELPGQDYDAALVLNGFSRWINYYLEGYRWMLENYKIDGVYMDDVSFDRPVLKRMKKIMNTYRSGSLIDLHSNTAYSIGPANQYAAFYPYIDRTWFGESFQYNKMSPDEWLITFSGIPFGEMSEMLQDGGNPFLGMVYGTTNRSHGPIWELWMSFGIENARMIGYWDEEPAVDTGEPNVKATVFVNHGKTLLVIGNFDDVEHSVSLRIDWAKLGLRPDSVKVEAPEMLGLQAASQHDLNQPIRLQPKKGVFLLISEE
ncbi:MAG: glycoside hydrolase domain-containing protein [Thermoguttaceae bacterium]